MVKEVDIKGDRQIFCRKIWQAGMRDQFPCGNSVVKNILLATSRHTLNKFDKGALPEINMTN